MKFKVGDKVKCPEDGFIGVVAHIRHTYIYPFVVRRDDDGAYRCYKALDLELVQPKITKEETMKFKVGDRVKFWRRYVGTITYIERNVLGKMIYRLDGKELNGVIASEYDLELVQPEAQEPVPGRFYRTNNGDKIFYVGKSKNDYFIYQRSDGEYEEYAHPFKYLFDDDDKSYMDIVGEWVDEVTLPAVEIKRWAVVFAKDTKEGKRGESLSIHTNVNSAHIFLNKLGEDMFDCEIVELTGTLPERKQ